MSEPFDYKDAAVRPQIRAALVGKVPDHFVDPIVDVAMHAADQACLAFERTVERLPNHASQVTALSIAAGIIASRMAQMQEALALFAKSEGLSQEVRTFTVGGGA